VRGPLHTTFHTGRRARAERAPTQSRAAGLSREGVAAVVTYLPAGLFALLWVGM